jgi:hypothetical protein
MEVHAHTHTARKKWTHYFWEFLMLFLAVFCGFLAENQREHFVEHNRENVFMKSLLEDLERDTSDLHNDMIFWENKVKRIDTFKAELNKTTGERHPALLYRCAAIMTHGNSFLYHDRTVNQLKYAGNFRLIRKKLISDSLSNYDSYIINTLKQSEENYQENSVALSNVQDQFFNSEYYRLINQPKQFDSAVASRPDIIAMRNKNEDLLFEYYNKLNSHQRSCLFRVRTHQVAKRRASNLINLIRKEYHLK